MWLIGHAGLVGGLLGLSLLKFGNPVILDRLVPPPQEFWEFLLSPWPVRWGYWMLGALLLAGLPLLRVPSRVPKPILWLPILWFGWQLIASAGTVDARLSRTAMLHFGSCIACFYLGAFCLGRLSRLGIFWMPLMLAFVWVLSLGFDQHFGGLEATRKLVQDQGGGVQYPPEYLKRLASDRIFSTLFYPNSLAGVVLLLLPALTVAAWRGAGRLTPVSRGVLVGTLAYAGAACLYWSGSKAGWLIAVAMGVGSMFRLPLGRSHRLWLAGSIVALALTGFLLRFSDYFQRGATSVTARRDYWQAAWTTAASHPWTGTGPGTFAIAYRQLKRPESEMAQLAHNDYLQQASDSGFPGALAYAAWILGAVIGLYHRCQTDPLRFAVWLGLAGWAAQSAVEFWLYIPALSWIPLALLGWLWSSPEHNGIDTCPRHP